MIIKYKNWRYIRANCRATYCVGFGQPLDQVWDGNERILTFRDDRTEMDQTSLHNWRRLIRDDKSATTYLSGNRLIFQMRPVVGMEMEKFYKALVGGQIETQRCRQSFNGYPTTFAFNGLPPQLTTGNNNAKKLASAKFYKKVRKQNRSMQGQVFLGELSKALQMIRHPAKSLFDLRGMITFAS